MSSQIKGLTAATGIASTWVLPLQNPATGPAVKSTLAQIKTALSLDNVEFLANKGVADGYAPLDGTGKIAAAFLPSYVDDILEYANLAAFPGTGAGGVMYVALDTGKLYRWSGSAYVEVSASPGSTDAVVEGATNLYYTNARVQTFGDARYSLLAHTHTTASLTDFPSQTGNANKYLKTDGTVLSWATVPAGYTDADARAAISSTAPVAYNSTTGVISMAAATTSVDGYLTSANWTTFNNKQAALDGTGFVKAVGTTISYDNSTYLTSVTTQMSLTSDGSGIKLVNDATSPGNLMLYGTDAAGTKGWYAQPGGGGGANALGTYIVQTATNAPANAQILASLATGIVKSTTTTGVLSIAVAADFPTLNQNTTGSAATLTTPRNIQGVSFNGSASIDIINGTGFVKSTGTTLSYDNSTYLTTASAASTYQPLDTDLTTIAGLTATTDNFIVSVSSEWSSRTPSQVRTTLGLVIGTNVQAWDADLDAIAALAGTTGFAKKTAANTWTLDTSTYITAANLALGTATVSTQPITNSGGTGFTLPVFGTNAGLVPGTATGTTLFLRQDGTWVAPGGTGADALGRYIVQIATNAPTNAQILASLGTGIVKNTTSTGVLSIAIAADFPTLNQNTTGSAATLTTSRTLWGQSFNGSANVTGSLTDVTDVTGGASSMIITAGTGNSRTITLRTTTGGGTATTALTLAADQSATFANTVTATTFVGAVTGTATKTTNIVGGNNTTLLGAMPYQSNTDVTTLLSPNTTSNKRFLVQTGTGTNGAAPSWAAIVAGDVPTLNQNTTGSAATLTTPRAIYGNNFDGSAALAQIIASTYGGTGNGFTKFSGATTAEKTYTLPNVSTTILTKDYTGALATGIVKNTTSTGELTIAVAGDFPTLNQNTTGTASKFTGMTLAEVNTAVTDADMVSIAGTETLTNKTLTSPIINTPRLGTSSTSGYVWTANDALGNGAWTVASGGTNYWSRSGTTLSTATSGDNLKLVATSDSHVYTLLHPLNYNVGLSQGRFSSSVGDFDVNGVGIRHNVVYNYAGYNTNPGGGQEIAGEASYRFAGETYYDIAGAKYMEFHIPEMFTDSGTMLRPLSLYIPRGTGAGYMNMGTTQANFKMYNDLNVDWAILKQVADNTVLELRARGTTGTSEILFYGKTSGINNLFTLTNNGEHVSFLNSGANSYFDFNRLIRFSEGTDGYIYGSFTQDKMLRLRGGSQGGTIEMYGESHATLPNAIKLYTGLYAGGNITIGAQNQIIMTVVTGGGSEAVGIMTTPNAKTVLDVASTTRGVRFTPMTTTERDAITSPIDGLMLYNTTTIRYEYYKSGTGWTAMAGATGGGSGDMVLADVQTNTGNKTFNSGTLRLAGSTSGTTILNANAVAGSGTVVLPTTGTLATLAGAEAFTNKDLTGAGNTFPTFNQSTTGNAANVTGVVAVTNGGTGVATITGLIKGNGTAAVSAAVAGTDFVLPRSVNTISSNTTAGAAAGTDYAYYVSNTTTLTLPTAVGNTNMYTIKNIGTGTVTVATTSSQTIDGSTTAIITMQYTSIDVLSDGANWFIL